MSACVPHALCVYVYSLCTGMSACMHVYLMVCVCMCTACVCVCVHVCIACVCVCVYNMCVCMCVQHVCVCVCVQHVCVWLKCCLLYHMFHPVCVQVQSARPACDGTEGACQLCGESAHILSTWNRAGEP